MGLGQNVQARIRVWTKGPVFQLETPTNASKSKNSKKKLCF